MRPSLLRAIDGLKPTQQAVELRRALEQDIRDGKTADLNADDFIAASGLRVLEAGCTDALREVALRSLGEMLGLLNGADPLLRTELRDHAIAEMTRLGARSPAALVDAALAMQTDPGADPSPDPGRRRAQADLLIDLTSDAELFHTSEGEAHATIKISDHYETWPIRARNFRRFLARQYYDVHQKAPSAQALESAIGVLEARAVYDGAEASVHVRVAELDGTVYLDLANSEWQAVRIDTTGWSVCDRAPVRFVRRRGALPLPHPVAGGSLGALRPYINVGGEEDWGLMLAWLVNALRPRGPYPVLALLGEQGAAKSTNARVLRALTDPNTAPLRAEPRDVRDVMIAATNGWIVAFDNVSHLPGWLSDTICRLATGGGFSTRELYTDREEILFDAQRPVIINGIETVVTRGDLMDRSLLVTLPPISDEARREEIRFWSAFDDDRPRILGALLDAVSAAIRNLPSVNLKRRPRMADFAAWVTAAEPALPVPPGSFIRAYAGNLKEANESVLEGSLAAGEIRQIGDFDGTAAQLLGILSARLSDRARQDKHWPKTPRGLSGALRRLAPNLRKVGITIEFEREPGGARSRMIAIRNSGDATVPIGPTVPRPTPPASLSPDGWDGRDGQMPGLHTPPAADVTEGLADEPEPGDLERFLMDESTPDSGPRWTAGWPPGAGVL